MRERTLLRGTRGLSTWEQSSGTEGTVGGNTASTRITELDRMSGSVVEGEPGFYGEVDENLVEPATIPATQLPCREKNQTRNTKKGKREGAYETKT